MYRGVDPGAGIKRILDYPFELMVALVSLLPPLMLGLNSDMYTNTSIVVRQLDPPFATVWAFICICGGALVLIGLLANSIHPVYVGLRLTSVGWSVFFILCELYLPAPKPHSDLFVLAGFIIVGVSVTHATRLSRRYRALQRSVNRIGG